MNIERHLTDPERAVLIRCAVRSVAIQTGVTDTEAAEVLATIADEGELRMIGDAENAYVTAFGVSIAHITREDLAAAAIADQEDL